MKVFLEKEEIITHCATTNAPEYNILKVLEELSEFQEAITKRITKHKDNVDRPKKLDVLQEFSDVVNRGLIYIKQLFPDYTAEQIMEIVDAHISKKLTNLETNLKNKQYKGGL